MDFWSVALVVAEAGEFVAPGELAPGFGVWPD